jgi:endogenous inhibitor of DNA gyrase (YacG/DUF329 family)
VPKPEPASLAPKSKPCPTCGRPVEWSADSTYRPFCSERCRLIDFGEWASERRAIPGEDELPFPDTDPDDPYRNTPPRH